MIIGKVSPVSFQAGIPVRVKDYLFEKALKRGSETCDRFFKQSKQFEQWGHDSSMLCVITSKTDDTVVNQLGLINNYLAPFKQAFLPKKGSLLDSFLNLREFDIIKAENDLKI